MASTTRKQSLIAREDTAIGTWLDEAGPYLSLEVESQAAQASRPSRQNAAQLENRRDTRAAL